MDILKTSLILLSLSTLVACDSDDSNTKYSDDYITNIATETESESATETGDSTELIDTDDSLILNGDFESWTDSAPDSWTTIDEGITVTKNISIYHSGATSAQVSVTTATQGDTDFRQSIDVQMGVTYAFSAWIYHTEGGVKARAYITDYQDYSDENLVNEWQELTYNYTATADEKIEVGLRFYDVSDVFDEEEIVYIDNFTFTESTPVDDTLIVEDPVIEDPITGNLIVNADFEYWTASVIDNWSSETGTTIVANSEILIEASLQHKSL